MKLDYNTPLIIPTSENTHPANIEELSIKYGKETVDEAIHYLTYRNVEELHKEENTGYPTLYIFRHGQTEDNAKMLFSGWRNVGITSEGQNQALILADKLQNKIIHKLYSSDMLRAIQTIELAISKNENAKTLEIIRDPRLRERSYGDWMGYSKLQKHLENPTGLYAVRRGYSDAPPNGESLEDTIDRVKPFLEEVMADMKENNINVAISCHGNSIRGFRQYFEGLDNDKTAEVETPLGKDYAAYPIK